MALKRLWVQVPSGPLFEELAVEKEEQKWRRARAAEWGGFENRYAQKASGVRILPPPQRAKRTKEASEPTAWLARSGRETGSKLHITILFSHVFTVSGESVFKGADS